MKENGMKHEYIELAGGDHGTIIGDGMADIFRFFAANPKTKQFRRREQGTVQK